MKTYIGTKIIQATPMNRADYNEYRGWPLPENENGADEGYLVEYTDGGKGNDSRHYGYISWSPKAQFEGAYREAYCLTFGLALEMLKKGSKIARAGWNGKGMWVTLSGVANINTSVPAEKLWNPHNAEFARQNGGAAEVQPCFTMKTAQNTIQMGWTASQSDMLAEDWVVVE